MCLASVNSMQNWVLKSEFVSGASLCALSNAELEIYFDSTSSFAQALLIIQATRSRVETVL